MHTQVGHGVVLRVIWDWTGVEFRAGRDCRTPHKKQPLAALWCSTAALTQSLKTEPTMY